jgi:hypothetical protein
VEKPKRLSNNPFLFCGNAPFLIQRTALFIPCIQRGKRPPLPVQIFARLRASRTAPQVPADDDPPPSAPPDDESPPESPPLNVPFPSAVPPSPVLPPLDPPPLSPHVVPSHGISQLTKAVMLPCSKVTTGWKSKSPTNSRPEARARFEGLAHHRIGRFAGNANVAGREVGPELAQSSLLGLLAAGDARGPIGVGNGRLQARCGRRCFTHLPMQGVPDEVSSRKPQDCSRCVARCLCAKISHNRNRPDTVGVDVEVDDPERIRREVNSKVKRVIMVNVACEG